MLFLFADIGFRGYRNRSVGVLTSGVGVVKYSIGVIERCRTCETSEE